MSATTQVNELTKRVPANSPPPHESKPNNIGNLSLVAVTVGFVGFKFVVPVWHPIAHEACVRFFEAGMVGGLADWFAVAALFGYPLNMTFIKHANLLLNNRPKIEASVGDMVRTLVTRERINETLAKKDLGDALRLILRNGKIKNRIFEKLREVSIVLARQAAGSSARHDVLAELSRYLENDVNYAAHIGEMLQDAQHKGTIDNIAEYAAKQLLVLTDEHADAIVDFVYEKIDPNMLEQFFVSKDRLKAYIPKIRQEIGLMGVDAKHPARRQLSQAVRDYSVNLRGRPETQAQIKQFILGLFKELDLMNKVSNLSSNSIERLIQDLERKDSRVIEKLDAGVEQLLAMLDDEVTRKNFDRQIKEVLITIVDDKLVNEVAAMAQSGINKYKPDEFVNFIESKVSSDLQYIRLNGAVVGGLTGLALYLLSQIPH